MTPTPRLLGLGLKKEEAKSKAMSPNKNVNNVNMREAVKSEAMSLSKNVNMHEARNELLRMKPTMKDEEMPNPQSEPRAVRAA